MSRVQAVSPEPMRVVGILVSSHVSKHILLHVGGQQIGVRSSCVRRERGGWYLGSSRPFVVGRSCGRAVIVGWCRNHRGASASVMVGVRHV